MVLVADDDTCLTPDIPKLLAATGRAYGKNGSISQRSSRSGSVVMAAVRNSLTTLTGGVRAGFGASSGWGSGAQASPASSQAAREGPWTAMAALSPDGRGPRKAAVYARPASGRLGQLEEEDEQQLQRELQQQGGVPAGGHVQWWDVVLASVPGVNQEPLQEWLALAKPAPGARRAAGQDGDWEDAAGGLVRVHNPWWDRVCTLQAGQQGATGMHAGLSAPAVASGVNHLSLSRAGSLTWDTSAHVPWWDKVLGVTAEGNGKAYEVAEAWAGGLRVLVPRDGQRTDRGKRERRGQKSRSGGASEDGSAPVDIGNLIPWWDRVLAGGSDNILNLFQSPADGRASALTPGSSVRVRATVALAASRLLHSFNRRALHDAAMPKEAASFCGRFLVIGWRKDMVSQEGTAQHPS